MGHIPNHLLAGVDGTDGTDGTPDPTGNGGAGSAGQNGGAYSTPVTQADLDADAGIWDVEIHGGFGGFGGLGANGGEGTGAYSGGSGGDGGSGATQVLSLNGVTAAGFYAYVYGGDGGDGGDGGNGGNTLPSASATTPGSGGAGGNAGRGGDATFAIYNSTFTDLTADAGFGIFIAAGGNGGYGGRGGLGGTYDSGNGAPGADGGDGAGADGGSAFLTFIGNECHFNSGALVYAALGGSPGIGATNGYAGAASVLVAGNSFTGSSGDDALSLAVVAYAGYLFDGTNAIFGSPYITFGSNFLDGGDGVDTLNFTSAVITDGGQYHEAPVWVDLQSGLFRYGNYSNTIVNFENVSIDYQNIVVIGGVPTEVAPNVVIFGDAHDNILTSSLGNDVLKGGAGNDTLDGGAGGDRMYGGTGDDTYYVDDGSDQAIEYSGQGTDTVFSTISFTLAGQFIENLTLLGTDNVDATGNSLDNILTGNSGANTLSGGYGKDYLDGGAGADTLIGGGGDDTYVVDNAGDVVTEGVGQGNDTILAWVSYSLSGRFVETLILQGTDNIDATGNSQANTLVGNSGDNVLNGGYGADMLTGGAGADTFVFSASSGADTITDFSATENDSINLHAYANGTAHAAWITQSGGDVTISLGGSNVVLVQNATVADVLAHTVW